MDLDIIYQLGCWHKSSLM